MKAAGSDVSNDSPEVGAGTAGESRPSVAPETSADPDSGESSWTIRDAESPSAAVVGQSSAVLSYDLICFTVIFACAWDTVRIELLYTPTVKKLSVAHYPDSTSTSAEAAEMFATNRIRTS
jgi:hypothetical protein